MKSEHVYAHMIVSYNSYVGLNVVADRPFWAGDLVNLSLLTGHLPPIKLHVYGSPGNLFCDILGCLPFPSIPDNPAIHNLRNMLSRRLTRDSKLECFLNIRRAQYDNTLWSC